SFELEANLPDQSQLTISIKNWNFLEGTELIGETTIDLEDRLYSKCYATCGLPKKFDLSGYNAWRDCHLPKDLLFKMCRKFSLLKPSFSNNKLIVYDPKDHPVFFPSDPDDQVPDLSQESDSDDDDNEEFKIIKINKHEQQLALDALNSWKKITKVDLIPEHVETRSLYNPEAGPELEQGKVQMWIDMFPMGNYKTSTVPKPVDITLRKPKKFQLRVVIKRTRNVILDDTNPITGEKKSDIYIKGFLCDQEKVYQSTDVHYNSFNGSGDFNWRFVFDFEYLPAEKKIVFSQRQKFGLSVIEGKSRPIVNLHCYDADNFSSDDLLGTLELDLSKFSQGAGSAEICSLKMKNDPKWPRINLFKRKFYKGWWPFEAIDGTLAGKLEAEFQIL
ncbi:fer-1 6 isoform X2, partial [Brachionus plicatilis]